MRIGYYNILEDQTFTSMMKFPLTMLLPFNILYYVLAKKINFDIGNIKRRRSYLSISDEILFIMNE